MLMYEFLMGIPPFHDSTPENIFENILNGAVEWPVVPDEMSEEGVDLLKRLLDPNPDTRIGSQGTAEIRNHPFFEGMPSIFCSRAFFWWGGVRSCAVDELNSLMMLEILITHHCVCSCLSSSLSLLGVEMGNVFTRLFSEQELTGTLSESRLQRSFQSTPHLTTRRTLRAES